MADLVDVQRRCMDKVFEASRDLQEADLVSRAIYSISRATFCVIDTFYKERFESLKMTNAIRASLVGHLKTATEWVTALYYLEEIDVPEMEALMEFASAFDPEVSADAVLASQHVQRSLADYSLEYFCDVDNEVPFDDAQEYLTEALACLELIARRLDTSLIDII